MTDSDTGLDVMPEGTQRGTPHKRALFGPGCSHSVSAVSNVSEARTGWPIENEFPEGAQSPGVDLADVVASCRKRVPLRIRIWLLREISDRAGQDLRPQLYPCLQEKLVGTSIVKCLRPLSVPMDGMV